MLREVKSSIQGIRLIPFQLTVAAATGTAASLNDFPSVTRNGSGDYRPTIKNPGQRSEIIIASRTAGSGQAQGFLAPQTISRSQFSILTVNGGGTAEDNVSSNGVVCAFDSATVSPVGGNSGMKFPVRTTWDRSRVIGGFVTSNALSIGKKDFTMVNSGTGVYDFTFSRSFGTAPVVMATLVSGSEACYRVSAITATGFTISTFSSGGGTLATDFYVIVIGVDAASIVGGGRGILMNSQRKPRLEVCRVNIAATPSITIHPGLGSVADSGAGTGDFTLTLGSKFSFARPPIVCLSSNGGGRNNLLNTATTSSVIRVNSWNSGGSLADGDDTDIFILGSDDATEY